MTIENFNIFIDKLINIKDVSEIKSIEILQNQKDFITEINKEQLFDGRATTGEDIRPYHSENKYFKNQEAVQKYIDKKEKFSKNVLRNKNIPNLYINGKFHSEIKSINTTSGVEVVASGKMALKILPDFDNILGLTPQNKNIVAQNIIIPKLIEYLKTYLS